MRKETCKSCRATRSRYEHSSEDEKDEVLTVFCNSSNSLWQLLTWVWAATISLSTVPRMVSMSFSKSAAKIPMLLESVFSFDPRMVARLWVSVISYSSPAADELTATKYDYGVLTLMRILIVASRSFKVFSARFRVSWISSFSVLGSSIMDWSLASFSGTSLAYPVE